MLADGLPDEAVEAIARMLDPAAWGEWAAPGKEAAQACALRRGAILLAALPAGVYVSDGQGKVKPIGDKLATVVRLLVIAIGDKGQQTLDHPDDADWMTVMDARDLLAALSATDTEKAGDGAE
jgi:hypothetical protein